MKRTLVRRYAAALALPVAAAACSDRPTLPEITEAPPPSEQRALLTCNANVLSRTVECGEPETPSAGGASFDRIIGGQGTYVRLTSSNVSYAADVFSFNVTVQNLMTVAMGTTDGATRDADGVRAFFVSDPVATGGTGTVEVGNATGTATFTGSNQAYFQFGGTIGGVDQGELGADGILSSGETSSAKNWRLSVPATVTSFSFTLLVATQTPPSPAVSIAPQVSSISPATLVPGASATLTGTNFNATPASNTVRIGGRVATVTAATTTSLTVTVPCVSSGNAVPVAVTTGGMTGATFGHPLQVTQRTVAVGQMFVTGENDTACNELTSVNDSARYVVSIFSNSTTAGSNSPFQFSADQPGAEVVQTLQAPASNQVAAPRLSFAQQVEHAHQLRSDEMHYRLLEENRRVLEQHGPKLQEQRRLRPARNVVSADPPLSRTFRVANINQSPGFCNSYYVVSATRVYFDGKLAIYEDDATPDAFKSSLNPTMASHYQRIGDQFNDDMEPIVRTYFGDILRRDAETDNNGVLVALFTPRLNNTFTGVAGFVVSCDQFPNDDTNNPGVGGPYTGTGTFGSSNHGEFFYAYQPTVNASGYNTTGTPDFWYRTIRSTFIHETKHVVSQAARVANNAPAYEVNWLEEGTARHVEELWGRVAVDNIPWKGNTGYGSAANPINTYCDVRPSGFAECDANTRRPAYIMMRHFSAMYTHIFGQNARLLSPFGSTPSDTQSYWYAISWSLVRYGVDRFAADEAAFFTNLTNATTTGMTNVNARLGTTTDQLLAGWTLALAVDDLPGFTSPPSADIQFATWNFRSIYAGLNSEVSGYSLPYPQDLDGASYPNLSFGTFAPAAITTLRGGGSLYYQIRGLQTAPQLLRLEGSGGTAVPSTVRMAVTRVR